MKQEITRSKIGLKNWPQIIFLLIVLCGIILRVACADNELWFDEIVSISLPSSVQNWWQIFTYYFDNNHILNSIYLHFADSTNPIKARALSIVGGVVSLFVIAKHPQNKFLLPLFSFSYPLALYSSEARGYATMIAAVLVAYKLLQSKILSSITGKIIWYATCLIGILSHISFLFFYLGVLSYAAYQSWQNRNSIKQNLILHIPVLCFSGILYFAFYRHLPPSSGPIIEPLEILINTLSSAVGGPIISPYNLEQAIVAIAIAFGFALLILLELLFQLRKRSALGPLYLTILVIVPTIIVLTHTTTPLFPRYFLVPIVFSYLLLGSLGARLWQTNLAGRSLVILIGLFFVSGNLVQIKNLFINGRGQYKFAMEEFNNKENLIVSTDHAIRNQIITDYYQQHFPTQYNLNVKFLGDLPAPTDGSQYYLAHSQDPFKPVPITVFSLSGREFKLIRETSTAALSGWRVFLYKSDILEVK